MLNRTHNDCVYRERCHCCNKMIYTHDSVVACHLDGHLYHSKCLDIPNKVAAEIIRYCDWICPLCCGDIFPFFQENSDDLTKDPISCVQCNKFISGRFDTVSHCVFCLGKAHSRCMSNNCCSNCNLSEPLNNSISSNISIDLPDTFNPYTNDFSGDEFSEETDDLYSTFTIASNILDNCSLITPTVLDCAYREHTSTNHRAIYYQNIDGFKSNFDEFRNQTLNITDLFSIYCFVETNLHESEPHDFHLPDYYSEHLYAIDGKSKGSGISLFFHKNVTFSRNYKLDMRNKYFECMGGSLSTSFGVFNIIVVYRFNKTNVDDYISAFKSVLSDYSDSPCLVVGDFNINCFNFNADQKVANYCESFFELGFSPLIGKATHSIRSSNTLIDQIWCNFFTEETSTHVLDISTSNHRPLVIISPLNLNSYIEPVADSGQSDGFITIHDINPKTYSRFSEDFNSYYSSFCDFYEIAADQRLDDKSTRTCFSDFFDNFQSTYTKHIIKEVKLNSSKRHQAFKPWVSIGIAKSCSIKNKLYRRWIKTRGTPSEIASMNEYKSYRSKLRGLIRSLKYDYFRQKFDKSVGDIKKSWRLVNEIRGKRNKLILPDHITSWSGDIIKERREICNHFNDYFVNIAGNLNNAKYSSYKGEIPDFRDFLKQSVVNSIYLDPITFSEVHSIISKLNSGKSSDFSPRLLKLFSYQISNILVVLLNRCMGSGIFPSELKTAKVLPLFKSGDKNVLANYRPISILPVFSKIYEKLIHVRLSSFLVKEKVLHDGQFGFRRGRSTIQALNTSVTSVLTGLESRQQTMGIFIDYSKAFDTIKHSILLHKLYHYGIRGIAYKLLTDYLSDRSQQVYLDQKTCSHLQKISCGVPQGSVLGPLLFIIYINDVIYSQCKCGRGKCIDNCAEKSLFVLFADDCNTFITDESVGGVFAKANNLLRDLKVYIDANYLHINLKKSKYILFKPPRTKKDDSSGDFKLNYDSVEIERVKSIKFLGVIINETLDWSLQVSSVKKKIAQVNGVLYKLRKTAPKKMLVSIFNALVQSHINYGISVWGHGGETAKLKDLFVGQKRAIRNIFGIKRVNKYMAGNTKVAFSENRILTVHNIYFKTLLIEAYQIKMFDTFPKVLSNTFKFSAINPSRFCTTSFHYSTLSKNFMFSLPRVWNAVNSTTEFRDKSFKSLQSFKTFLKTYILRFQSAGEPMNWDPSNTDIFNFISNSF